MKLASDELEFRVQENLDRRARHWFRELKGQVTLERCRQAAIEFVGYPTRAALAEDYGEDRKPPVADFDPSRMDDRLKQWLAETDAGVAKNNGRRTMRALIAFGCLHGAPAFEVVLAPKVIVIVRWEGTRRTTPISDEAAAGLFAAVSASLSPEGGHHTIEAWRSPLGSTRFQWWQAANGKTMKIRSEVELFEPGLLADAKEAQPFLDSLLAQRRAGRAGKPSPALPLRRPRSRS